MLHCATTARLYLRRLVTCFAMISAGLAGTLLLPAQANASCVSILTLEGKTYQPATTLHSTFVLLSAKGIAERPQCADVLPPTSSAPAPEQVETVGLTGVRPQLAISVPIPRGKRFVYAVYARPGICRAPLKKSGTRAFVLCLKKYPKRID